MHETDPAGKRTDGHHEYLSWSGHIHHPLRVLEDLNHHFLFRLGGRFTLWMRTGVNNTVHVD